MIEWRKEENRAFLCLAQPPCNEIGSLLLGKLEDFLAWLEEQGESIRVLVIYSALPTGFSAGADLRELYQQLLTRPTEEHAQQLGGFLERIHRVMDRLDQLPFPSIGLIQGVCFGGGFELALTCDLRIAERHTRFCFPELRLGLIPGFGGIPRLKREVGNGIIQDLILTGRSLNAQKAQQVGLVSQVLAKGEGFKVAEQMARQIARFDPYPVQRAKRFIKALPKELLQQEKELFLELFTSSKVQQALKNFVESKDLRPYL